MSKDAQHRYIPSKIDNTAAAGIVSANIAAAGTVTSAGKDVNGLGSLAITVDVTAISGSGTTLDVTVEGTFDDTTWFTVATIPQFTTGGGAAKKCALVANGLTQIRFKEVTVGASAAITRAIKVETRK
jgi:hypothetical protein